MKLHSTSKPECPIEKVGRPYVRQGITWQTWIPTDAADPRMWEHNETRDQWFEVEGA